MHQPLADEPFVRRLEKVLAELLLERGEAPVAFGRQFLDRNIREDAVVHDLFEVLLGQVHVAQDFAFEAALALRQDQVDQFGELQVDGRVVVGEQVVAQSGIDRGEEVFQRGPRRATAFRIRDSCGRW